MKPPARTVVGNLVWSTDGGVWAVWGVVPFPHAHTAVAEKLSVHAQLRGLLMSLPADSMLLSICEQLSPFDVVDRMAEGIDLETHRAWDAVCGVSAEWLKTAALRRRRYYVMAALNDGRPSWQNMLRDALGDVGSAFGISPRSISGEEIDQLQRQARALQMRLGQHVTLMPVTSGEVCWLYARSLRREIEEPPFDEAWEPPAPEGPGSGELEQAERRRPRGVLAHLTDVVVKEGGYGGDQDRPRHRRYVRIDHAAGTAYQTVLAMSDMPHFFRYPGGGGESLFQADRVGFPVDWCVRIRSVPNADAQGKVRRKQRDLIGQVDEYEGEVSGAPPQLAQAIRSIGTERSELGANPAEPELQATILMSVAAGNLTDLEERAGALQAMFEPEEYGLARPTGGQASLLRAMLPGTSASPVCRDYTQFMLTRDLAAGAPFCGTEVGDPHGLLLGVSLDDGNGTPVLYDPAYGPRVNASPSLAAVGRLGSGKSFFLKRLCWDTVARGGQVVTIDRTHSGEYARLGDAMPGRVQVVRLEAGADTRLDPLRTFTGDQRSAVTLGFLSLLAGSSAHSEEGAALAEAVDAVVEQPEAALMDVLHHLQRVGSDPDRPDEAARGLARRLAHYATSPIGKLAFGEGEPLTLDADFIVFWAPDLSLADRETLASDQGGRLMLPEQVLGQALLYLVAAVGRRVVFQDPSRFAAALYDEAWALLASPHGQNLLIEGVRDGRKHNGAIWLASQHPNDVDISELSDLLGSKFVFRQARQAVPASLEFLGVDDSVAAAATLEGGLDTGVCLYRDVRDRVGLLQVLPPALPELDELFNTAPQGAAVGASDRALDPGDDDPAPVGASGPVGALGTEVAGVLEPGDDGPAPDRTGSGNGVDADGLDDVDDLELEDLDGLHVDDRAGCDGSGDTPAEPIGGGRGSGPDPTARATVTAGDGAGGPSGDDDDGAGDGTDAATAARVRARRRRRGTPLSEALSREPGS